MEQVIKMDTHPTWKHVKSGKPYSLMGYGRWQGGVHDVVSDNAEVVVARPKGMDGIGDFSVVPGHYTVTDMKTADTAILQTSRPLVADDVLVIYQGEHYDNGNRAYARLYAEFFDGRFVKLDAEGNEIAPPAPAKKAEKKDA